MSDADVAELHAALVERRRALARAIAEAEAGRSATMGCAKRIDDRAADRSERLRAAQVGERHARELAAVDAALARLEGGTYGLSAESGEPIGASRLRALPWAVRRADES
ncbi:MAG: hypothetical protein AAGH15_25310 [Myxococcota bacterium]